MKKAMLILTVSFILSVTFPSISLPKDFTRWDLPEGAKMRFGKGEIYDIKFSPDGSMFAVGSGIGIWLYDVKTKEPLRFLKVQTNSIHTIGFINEGKNIIGATESGFIYGILTHLKIQIK